MINKFYKLINNKFYRLFKFIFFLRYLLAVFFIALSIFLIIPQFFDYKKKGEIIKQYLAKNYFLEIEDINNIKYKPFPFPSFQMVNIDSNFFLIDTKLKIKKLIIYPKLFSIYNFNNFQINKIALDNNEIETNFKNIQILINKIFNIRDKISLENLSIKIKNEENKVIDFKKINFTNYGYKKHIIKGEVFNKEFQIKLIDGLNSINFKLFNTGVEAFLNITQDNNNRQHSGVLKGKILKSKYKIHFDYIERSLKIKSFIFRDQNLSFDSKGIIELGPFFQINLSHDIKSFNYSKLKDFDLNNFLSLKDFIKKINANNDFIFKSSKFSTNLLSASYIKTNLSFGRLLIDKKFNITNSNLTCKSNINLLEEFPTLYFNCSIYSPNKKKLFKKINLKLKTKKIPLTLEIQGNLNILKKKINFDRIEMDNSYIATEEDLKYFKNSFEKIVFNSNFLNIFDLSKIKKFILEIV